MTKRLLLSHPLNPETPTYGGKTRAEFSKSSDMAKGDAANNTVLSMSLHTGTHIDMPCHFFADGQTAADFGIDFWFFESPLFIDIKPKGNVIKDELISQLTSADKNCDCIIVRTGFDRYDHEQLMKNPGFHADTADFIRTNFKHVRLFGFDSISVSSFADREEGRRAHRAFLNPEQPIILLEDMNIKDVASLKRLSVIPMMIEGADGLPVTVIGEI